jgi:predicted  nucleic acid-binding Zn-ribbon protein
MSLRCTVCGCAFFPPGTWHEDWCPDCHTRNFAASQELRLHDEGQPLTDRQRAAHARIAVAHAREAEHQRYEQDCRAALQQLMAGEDTHG